MFDFDLLHYILISIIIFLLFVYLKKSKLKKSKDEKKSKQVIDNALLFFKKTVKIKSEYGEVLQNLNGLIEKEDKLPNPKSLILSSAKILALNSLVQENKDLFSVYKYMYYSVSFFQDIKEKEVKKIQNNNINIKKLHEKLYRNTKEELTKEELNLFIESQDIDQKYIKKSQDEGNELILEFDNFIEEIKNNHSEIFNKQKYKQLPVLYLFLKNNYPELVKKIEKAYVEF